MPAYAATRRLAPRRAVVIGAGHNGLLCAGTLAEAGWDVTVLEASQRAGGAVHSCEGPLPGFVEDPCSGFFPLTRASPAFEGIDLPGLEWIDTPVVMAHPLSDGRVVTLHRDVGATVESLEAARPGAGRAWAELVDPLLRHRDLVRRVALARFPPAAAGAALALRLRRFGIELGRLMAGSAATLGRYRLGGDEPAAWLAGSAVHSDLAPDAPGSAAFSLFLHLLGHMVGWPFPRGEAAALTRALVARVERAGGVVRLGTPVARIELDGGRVTGVLTADGERLPADAAVAAVSVRPLLAMLPSGAFPARLERELGRWRYGLGTFKVDYALAEPVPWTHPEPHRAAVVHVGDTLEHQIEAARTAGLGRVPRAPSLVVGQHSRHDPGRAPPGRHTLYVYTHVPSRPDLDEDAIVELIEGRIEAFAPGFRRSVLGRSVRPPWRLEQDNASLVGGDLGGGSFEVDQQLLFRPAPELFRYRTPLRGLYFASASAHPGGGVHGVPGAGAARAALRDARRPGRLARAPRRSLRA